MKICAFPAVLLFASFLHAATFTCNLLPDKDAPPLLRAEGLRELISDLNVQCAGGLPTALGDPVPAMIVSLQLNTSVTSPFLYPSNSPLVNSSILIDESAGANIFFNPTGPGSRVGYNGNILGNGTGLNFTSGVTPNAFYGTATNANGISFAVPIDPVPAGRNFKIQNILVNGNQFAAGTLPANAIASISVSVPVWNYSQTFPPIIVGNAQSGMITRFQPSAASHQFPLNPSLLAVPPSLPQGSPQTLFFPGNAPGAMLPTGPTGAGLTDFGTRLKAVFNNVPNGVNIFVSVNQTSSSAKAISEPFLGLHNQATVTPQAQLISTATAAGTTGYSKLPVTNGSATAVWQVQQVDPTVSTTFNFGAYVAFNSGGTIDTAPAAPTNITITQGYDSPPGGQSFVAPNANTPPGIFFTINSATGATPVLSATVDSRKCVIGATYSDPNNACAPGQNPQVLVSSDSGVLTPSFSAATNSGVSINGAFTGSTPVNGSLSVSAAGASPGTSQQTLKFTASGSANVLQIPYSVTVLPSNNPEIKPGGITDGFSFQGGSIAPGQIFALFGTNFGPASLQFGTLDASGKLSTTVASTQVLFDGVPAPLIYVVKNQLSGVAPFSLKGKTSTQVQLVSNNLTSPVVTLPVTASTLSIATLDGSGGNGGVIVNQDGSINSTQHPAAVGDTVVIYASYAGPFTNGVTGTDGRTTVAAPYPAPAGTLAVTMGGVQATSIPYFGNAPTLLESVIQINVVVPAGVKSGSIPLTISANGITSVPWTSIAIK